MVAVAGKLWCTDSNKVIVLNPSTLISEVRDAQLEMNCSAEISILWNCFSKHHFGVDGEKKLFLATGGTNSWAVWVASQQSMDIRLYHATKFNVLAEINIKQYVVQKLNGKNLDFDKNTRLISLWSWIEPIYLGLEEIVRIHKISCLKITCLFVCKDTLWIGTSAGVIVNIKVPHISNTTSKLNTTLSYNGKPLLSSSLLTKMQYWFEFKNLDSSAEQRSFGSS